MPGEFQLFGDGAFGMSDDGNLLLSNSDNGCPDCGCDPKDDPGDEVFPCDDTTPYPETILVRFDHGNRTINPDYYDPPANGYRINRFPRNYRGVDNFLILTYSESANNLTLGGEGVVACKNAVDKTAGTHTWFGSKTVDVGTPAHEDLRGFYDPYSHDAVYTTHDNDVTQGEFLIEAVAWIECVKPSDDDYTGPEDRRFNLSIRGQGHYMTEFVYSLTGGHTWDSSYHQKYAPAHWRLGDAFVSNCETMPSLIRAGGTLLHTVGNSCSSGTALPMTDPDCPTTGFKNSEYSPKQGIWRSYE